MDDDNIIERLNLDELYNEKKIAQDNKLKVYNKILKRAHQKIKHTSRQKNSLCFCCFVFILSFCLHWEFPAGRSFHGKILSRKRKPQSGLA